MESPAEINDALEQMLAALRTGAYPWVVDETVGKYYKDALSESFKDCYDGYWKEYREKVKRMAMHSGSVAGLIAQAGREPADQTPPGYLSKDEVFGGSAVVATSKACYDGRFCQKAVFRTDPEYLKKALKTLYGDSVKVV